MPGSPCVHGGSQVIRQFRVLVAGFACRPEPWEILRAASHHADITLRAVAGPVTAGQPMSAARAVRACLPLTYEPDL